MACEEKQVGEAIIDLCNLMRADIKWGMIGSCVDVIDRLGSVFNRFANRRYTIRNTSIIRRSLPFEYNVRSQARLAICDIGLKLSLGMACSDSAFDAARSNSCAWVPWMLEFVKTRQLNTSTNHLIQSLALAWGQGLSAEDKVGWASPAHVAFRSSVPREKLRTKAIALDIYTVLPRLGTLTDDRSVQSTEQV